MKKIIFFLLVFSMIGSSIMIPVVSSAEAVGEDIPLSQIANQIGDLKVRVDSIADQVFRIFGGSQFIATDFYSANVFQTLHGSSNSGLNSFVDTNSNSSPEEQTAQTVSENQLINENEEESQGNDEQIQVRCIVAGDANRDCILNFSDILYILANWGPCPELVAAGVGSSCSADLNGDGVVNQADIDIVQNYWSRKPGDANRDGVVNFKDILDILAAWGPCPILPTGVLNDTANDCSRDLNGDGVLNQTDIDIVLKNWPEAANDENEDSEGPIDSVNPPEEDEESTDPQPEITPTAIISGGSQGGSEDITEPQSGSLGSRPEGAVVPTEQSREFGSRVIINLPAEIPQANISQIETPPASVSTSPEISAPASPVLEAAVE